MSYMPCTCTVCEKVITECDAIPVQGVLGNDLPVCRECYLELHQTEEDYHLFRKGESHES